MNPWFKQQGWSPYQFQTDAWSAYFNGESGLIHVPTGSGKTYAAFMGPLASLMQQNLKKNSGLRVLYVTPLKAVSRDIELALRKPIDDLKLSIAVGSRTGDTKPSTRAKQKINLPEILVTTPESLQLLLSYNESAEQFKNLECVIVDEWHELIQSKRGSLMELGLARLRMISPKLRTWALTATVANLEEAALAASGSKSSPRIIQAEMPRPIHIESLIPDQLDTFPWAGHLGIKMTKPLSEWLDLEKSTLIFTNTRSQAERWYQALVEIKPEWTSRIALHHGSLDRSERERVEHGIKNGGISFVVCTSSLDLGVDFGLVERVVQIGSPKGIARLIQRAGRSGHRPGESCMMLFVPTHALELVEIAAARQAVLRKEIEPRLSLNKPMDVLTQYLVTRALGGGFSKEEIYNEVTSAYSFSSLTKDELNWAIEFVVSGGATLRNYSNYHRVKEFYGRYIVEKPKIARLHRMNIGTIISDAGVQVTFQAGKKIGTIEESFISRLRKGDVFVFGGRNLEFIRMKDLKAQVKLAKKPAALVSVWAGSRLPFSTSLSHALRSTLDQAERGQLIGPEIFAVQHILKAQRKISAIPHLNELLVETCVTREGHHLFIYPFDGRSLHEGLAALIALRLASQKPATFSASVNDYGFELVSPEPFPYERFITKSLFSTDQLIEDLHRSMNLAELAKSEFREIARVAGLVQQTLPGKEKSMRQVQVSSSLLYDVFRKYDEHNLLIKQAERQVLEKQLENSRLLTTLERLQKSDLCIRNIQRPSPLGFPLIAERLSARLSTETLSQRLEKMKEQWSSFS